MQKMRKESKPMKNNIVAEYDYYTLDQAREIVYQEMRHDRITREFWTKKKMIQKRKEKLFYVKQKLSGIVTIAIGMIIPVLIKDITFSIVAISLGMYLILTKRRVMYFGQ
jgi:hypothetical protein